MTGHLPNLPSSVREPDLMELVWENGEVLIRGLSAKKTVNKSRFSSHYLSQSSKDGVAADSTFVNPISGLSSLTKQCYDKQLDIVPVNKLKLKEKKTKVDHEDKDKVNFSMFLRSPQALIESNNPSSGATRAGDVGSLPPMSSNNPFEKDGNFTDKKMKAIVPYAEPQKESVADQQSEAVPNKKLAPELKGNPEQIVPSSSFCSLGASNCPAYSLQRRYEQEEDTDDISKDTAMEEESQEKTKGSEGRKRKRKTEVHNLSEKKRREKINKKMRALKELIPNCNKVDKASMLDEAIEYLKNLQFQVQMMSMGNGVYMPPMMFPSPSAMQHINAQHLGGYSPMMGMGMQMGLGYGAPPQFPPTLMPRVAAALPPGMPDGRVNMFGFPNEVLLSSMSRSPFVSSVGSFTPQSIQPYGAGVSLSQSAAATAVARQGDLPGGFDIK